MKKAKKLLRKLAIAGGLPVYSATARWPNDPSFKEARERAEKKGVKGIPDDRCFTLHKIAAAAAGLDGDLAECGCRQGKSTRFILAGLGIESEKTIHIFDSFEGLSAPTGKDKLISGNSAWKPNALATAEDVLVNNLQMYEHMIAIYKGWIPDRFAEVADKKISMVHIDVDLYEPTIESLKFFYPRMVSRGVIICDDYGSVSCPGAKKAFDEFFADKPELLIELPTVQALVVKA